MINKYWRLITRIFDDSSNPSSFRLNSYKEWLIMSSIICTALCLPCSLLLGALFFLSPKEDSVFLYMLIPWMFFVPIIPIITYWYHYRLPKKNDLFINRIFKSITPNLLITEDGSCYDFVKNDFLFRVFFEIQFSNRNSHKTKKRIDIINIIMFFDFPTAEIPEYDVILADMDAYLKGKIIGNAISPNYYSLNIRIERKALSESSIKRIIEEFLYLAERFTLKSVTLEEYMMNLTSFNNYYTNLINSGMEPQ